MRFGIGAIVIVALVGYYQFSKHSSQDAKPTAKVERGTIEELVAISGTVSFTQDATLNFPVNGTVAEVRVDEGSTVAQGDVLATLEQHKLQADYADAVASLQIAIANRDELIAGPRPEAREVTALAIQSAESALRKTESEQNEIVENALHALYSTDLVATPERKENSDTAPTISGSYSCKNSGTYILDIYPSSARSGYSYKLSGLEQGSANAYTESPQPLGSCGLFIQFDQDTSYGMQRWTIEIPNKRSSSYVTNLNAYTLAMKKRDTAITAAQDALESAQKSAAFDNATPRSEALARAEAVIAQADARIAAIKADIEDRTIRAPFSGTVTAVPLLPGETAEQKGITMVANNAFELTVRIPEIDITKVSLGDSARVVLDARQSETLTAHVTFISPLATLIDGVSYYEAHLTFDATPEWMRGGLNADVDILTDSRSNVLRLPQRFISTVNGSTVVTVRNGNKTSTRPVELGFKGGDGFVEVKNLEEGLEVILP